jgi:DNA adenine methylase
MKLTSPFCRVGRKRRIKDIIEKHSPEEFDIYVEPFVGTGDIYFHLTTPKIQSYLNDKDKMVVEGFELLKKNIPITDIEKFKTMTHEMKKVFVKQSHSEPIDKLATILYIQAETYGGKCSGELIRSKSSNIETKLRKVPKYSEFMKNTTITNGDYKTLLKHDTPNTFFFFDPPYEKSDKLYSETEIDYRDMANKLKNLKGKFILTINDSPLIRDIFKDFEITPIDVMGRGKQGVGKGIRKELLIKNY